MAASRLSALLLALMVAGPALAGGIDEPVFAPEKIAGRATPPARCWLDPSECGGGDGASHGSGNTPAHETPTPVVTGTPRWESKESALARVYGITDHDWKNAPDGGAAARAYWENNGRKAGEARGWANFNG